MTSPQHDRDRALLLLGVVGVAAYVATWALLGIVAPDHDPFRDAISQLFDLGAPVPHRTLLTTVLAVTGVLLVAVAFALDRALPGEGRVAVWLTVVAGLGTVLVTPFPCSDGCPGFGVTTTDTLHTVLAGGGYVGLVLAPLAWAWRLRDTDEGLLVLLGLLLGGLATVGFVTRNVVGLDALGGLQQRVFNTAADLWFVAAAVRGRSLLAGLTRPVPATVSPPSDDRPDAARRR